MQIQGYRSKSHPVLLSEHSKCYREKADPATAGVQPSPRSIKSAISRTTIPGASVVSAVTQDAEYSGNSEVRDYPVWVDTCVSDIYIPTEKHLDADSSRTHSRVTDRLNVQQADGTMLISSGLGTLAGVLASHQLHSHVHSCCL